MNFKMKLKTIFHWLLWKVFDSTEMTGVDTRVFDIGQRIIMEFSNNPEFRGQMHYALVVWKRGDQLYVRIGPPYEGVVPSRDSSIMRSVVNEDQEEAS